MNYQNQGREQPTDAGEELILALIRTADERARVAPNWLADAAAQHALDMRVKLAGYYQSQGMARNAALLKAMRKELVARFNAAIAAWPTHLLDPDPNPTLENRMTKQNEFQVRQGDVYIVGVDEIPADSVIVKRDAKRVVLAYGEVTGHAHAFYGRGVTLREQQKTKARHLKLVTRGLLKHEEHAPISVPPGTHRVLKQFEYTPEELQQVAD